MALADAVDLLGVEAGASLRDPLTDLLERMARLATGNGLWLQVPDRPDVSGNYEESSASAMIAYASLPAGRNRLWSEGEAVGVKALESLISRLQVDGAGRLRLTGICQVAGLGGTNGRRDGTAAYYLSEPIVADDPKGVGPFLMAEAEWIDLVRKVRAGEPQPVP
jgi:unsaturated rhamnogalacturonyl hydrolase